MKSGVIPAVLKVRRSFLAEAYPEKGETLLVSVRRLLARFCTPLANRAMAAGHRRRNTRACRSCSNRCTDSRPDGLVPFRIPHVSFAGTAGRQRGKCLFLQFIVPVLLHARDANFPEFPQRFCLSPRFHRVPSLRRDTSPLRATPPGAACGLSRCRSRAILLDNIGRTPSKSAPGVWGVMGNALPYWLF